MKPLSLISRRAALFICVFFAAATLTLASPAMACSVTPDYRVPTNLELAEGAELVLLGRVVGEAKADGGGPWDSALLIEPIEAIKGETPEGAGSAGTLAIGGVGLVPDLGKIADLALKGEGNVLVLIGREAGHRGPSLCAGARFVLVLEAMRQRGEPGRGKRVEDGEQEDGGRHEIERLRVDPGSQHARERLTSGRWIGVQRRRKDVRHGL